MATKYNFSDLNTDYEIIYILNKYLSESQFVRAYSFIDSNHFILDSGFLNEKLFKNITVGYLDIVKPDNDSIGRQKLRAIGCEYKVYASLKPRVPDDTYYSYMRDRYEIVLMDIHKNDYDNFLNAMNSIINSAFNNRELEYFELLISILQFTYSVESAESVSKKSLIKMKAYGAYLTEAIKYHDTYTEIIKELQEDSAFEQHDEKLFGRRSHKNG